MRGWPPAIIAEKVFHTEAAMEKKENQRRKNKRESSMRRIVLGTILFAAAFCLLYSAANVDGMAQWYATHIYPVIVGSVGRIFGWFPISVSEIALYLLLLMLILCFLRLLIHLIRRKCGRREVGRFLSGLFLTAAVLFFIYTIHCGINYHRKSFSESADIVTSTYTVEELKVVCQRLTVDVNERVDLVERNKNRIMQLDGSEQAEAVRAMEALGEIYPELSGYYPKPKGLLNSWILSVQNLTGVYSPFTVEANYNSSMTDYNIPFTACHELSHLRGFMQEEEANFIAYLACMESDDIAFQYSGSLLGWIHCMNVLRKADLESWREVREELSEAAEADLRANSDFWAQYEGKAAEVADMVNDSYLKANGQTEGVKSYSRMVDLIVAYYKER